jgi:His-Xaa-Ser system protein HxsD
MTVDVLVDANVYPLEVVMGAAYVFVDRCFLLLDRIDGGRVRVAFTARPEAEAGALEGIAGEFQNELLAQALRARLTERHEKLREALVARALFGAAPEMAPAVPAPTDEQLGLEGRFLPAEGDDYLDDPLGIAVPWEEKYATADQPAGAAAGAPPSTPGRDPR